MPFAFNGRVYAIYHTREGFFASDDRCAHEAEPLTDNVVIDNVIECPRYQGCFDLPSGKVLGAPVCVDLQNFAAQIHGGDIYVQIPGWR